MSDLIRDALERLVNLCDVRDWELNDREWHVAMSYARKVLADIPRAALAAQPPADAPSPAPVAWCSSDDFMAAAEKRQSFRGFREQWHSDCDMALYAAPPPAPACDGKQNVHRELAQWLEQHRQPAPPPAPAPIDIDALLSPEGAYEPGTGQEDGAQLVDQLEWWAPLYGCETLDNLLHQLRARILPHLRPPVAGIDVPGPDGDYGNVIDLCAAEGVDYRVGVPLLKRARQAWKVAAQPPAPASEGELGDLAGCVEAWAARLDEGTPEERLLGRVAYVLRQRQALPHDGEVNALIKILSRIARMLDFMPDNPPNGLVIHRVIELLRQPAPAPAVVPVPVAERPWEREEWCDAQGRCWWSHGPTPTARWSLLPMDGMDDARGWLLPHWAIPIPQPPLGGEVQP